MADADMSLGLPPELSGEHKQVDTDRASEEGKQQTSKAKDGSSQISYNQYKSAKANESDEPSRDAQGRSAAMDDTDTQGHLAAFSTAVAAWSQFQLDEQRTKLDRQALVIADQQEASVRSRKKLAESTRSFKRSLHDGGSGGAGGAASPQKMASKAFGSLLKEYQAEVDNLTQRSKSAEAALLEILRALDGLPDPVPLLYAAAQMTEELHAARQELMAQHFEREQTRHRLEATQPMLQHIMHLEHELQGMHVEFDQRIKSALEHQERVWQDSQREQAQNFELREQQLRLQVSSGERELRSAQHTADTLKSRLFAVQSQLDELRAARAAEDELGHADMQRTRAENEELQRRIAQLERGSVPLASSSRVATPSSSGARSAGADENASVTNVQLAAHEVRISQLNEELEAARQSRIEEQRGNEDAKRSLRQRLDTEEKLTRSLRQQLAIAPSSTETNALRSQVKLLRTLSGVADEDDDEATDADEVSSADANAATAGTAAGAENAANAESMATLHRRLARKIRTAEQHSAEVKRELSERSAALEDEQQKNIRLSDMLNNSHATVQQLEEQINALTAHLPKPERLAQKRDSAARSGGASALKASKPGLDRGSDGIGEASASSAGTATAARPADEDDGGAMLKVITEQRDRFRLQLQDSEEAKRRLQERLDRGQVEQESTKEEIVQLYARIRFLQSYAGANCDGYGGDGRDGRASPLANGKERSATERSSGATLVNVGHAGDDGPLSKYRSMYEDTMNPFTAFSRRERTRRIHELSTAERVTLKAGQRVLGSRALRLFVFFYVIGLHSFVFLVLTMARSICAAEFGTGVPAAGPSAYAAAAADGAALSPPSIG